MIKTPEQAKNLHYGNVPVLRHKWRDLTLEGYSRAAIQTYWRIPELKLLVDHGAHPWDFAGVSNLCLTHMHPDHSAGLISYLASRSVLNTKPPKVYLHPSYLEPATQLVKVWSEMMQDHLPVEWIPCQSGDQIPFGQNKELEVFSTTHVIPSQGYLVNHSHHKIKPEHAGKSAAEIKALKNKGTDIHLVKKTPRIAICGDTTTDVFDQHPVLAEAEILVVEVTFVGDAVDCEHARRFGHIHIDEFVALLPNLNNSLIVISHFSSRYRREETLAFLEKKIPDQQKERLVAWI